MTCLKAETSRGEQSHAVGAGRRRHEQQRQEPEPAAARTSNLRCWTNSGLQHSPENDVYLLVEDVKRQDAQRCCMGNTGYGRVCLRLSHSPSCLMMSPEDPYLRDAVFSGSPPRRDLLMESTLATAVRRAHKRLPSAYLGDARKDAHHRVLGARDGRVGFEGGMAPNASLTTRSSASISVHW